ncbi:MAG: hypothetical protein J5835_03815, partial [Bacteroidales bacterium]|nr:hypothetical protein [Bacteroidales bacterium]
GKDFTPALLEPRSRYNYLPHNHALPLSYRMAENGLILREDILDTAYVQEIYITPRNFLYQMNRLTDSKIVEEQLKDNTLPPVTLETIENGVPDFDMRQALVMEQGRVDRAVLTDIELCAIIDSHYLPRFLNTSGTVYDLAPSRRTDMANAIWADARRSFVRNSTPSPIAGRKTDAKQIRRCVVLYVISKSKTALSFVLREEIWGQKWQKWPVKYKYRPQFVLRRNWLEPSVCPSKAL